MTILDLILDEAGTKARLASWCGVTKQAVFAWYKNERIPPEYWPVLIKRVPGVTANRLFREFYGNRAA